MKINFDVPELAAIEPGQYDAILTGFNVVQQAKSSGKPYVKLSFTISGGSHEGRKLSRNYSLQPQSLWAIQEVLKSFGVPTDDMVGDLEIEDILQELVGRENVITVSEGMWRGRVRPEIVSVGEDFESQPL